MGYSISDGPQLSIGGLIDGSDLVARGTVTELGGPRWNSEDGEDWHAEMEENPEDYATVPFVLTQVRIVVEEILDGGPETSQAPAVASGDSLVVEFHDNPTLDACPGMPTTEPIGPLMRTGLLAVGDERIFFLQWRGFPVAVGEGHMVWQGFDRLRIWGTDAGLVFPGYHEHAFSLVSGGALGDITVETREGLPAVIPVTDLMRIIELERETPQMDSFASYEHWPPRVPT